MLLAPLIHRHPFHICKDRGAVARQVIVVVLMIGLLRCVTHISKRMSEQRRTVVSDWQVMNGLLRADGQHLLL